MLALIYILTDFLSVCLMSLRTVFQRGAGSEVGWVWGQHGPVELMQPDRPGFKTTFRVCDFG